MIFFEESTYKDAKGETRPCYRITKKGCEFIAHKLTGTKGTIFTARYINRFHEMEDIILNQKPKAPKYFRWFRGRYIMLFRDFESLTGITLVPEFTSPSRPGGLLGGCDYNAWATNATVDKEAFRNTYGFDYGDDWCMEYLTLSGVERALWMCRTGGSREINQAGCKLIEDELNAIQKGRNVKKQLCTDKKEPTGTDPGGAIHIQITGDVILCGERSGAAGV